MSCQPQNRAMNHPFKGKRVYLDSKYRDSCRQNHLILGLETGRYGIGKLSSNYCHLNWSMFGLKFIKSHFLRLTDVVVKCLVRRYSGVPGGASSTWQRQFDWQGHQQWISGLPPSTVFLCTLPFRQFSWSQQISSDEDLTRSWKIIVLSVGYS